VAFVTAVREHTRLTARHEEADMDDQAARQLAADLIQSGDHQGAATVLRGAVQHARASGDLETVSLLLEHESRAWWNAGDIDQARTALTERLLVMRELGDARGLAETLVGLWMFPGVDRGDRANYLREARELADTHGFSDIARDIEWKRNLARSAGIDFE
jgi:hypothetical protein